MTSEAWTCASPDYLAAKGTPRRVADLHDHVLIGYRDHTTTWTYRRTDGALEHLEFRPAAVVSDSAALRPLLAGGGGIGRLPDFLAGPAVARGDLIRLFPEARGDDFDIHALYTSHRSLSARSASSSTN